MHWHYDRGEFFFECDGQKKQFLIELTPEAFNTLDPKVQAQFIPCERGYQFGYLLKALGTREKEVYLAARRMVQGGHPMRMDVAELKKWAEGKKVIFYTGAGISAAAGIPTMHQLGLLFPFTLEWVEASVAHPEAVVRKIDYFESACRQASPTKAHFALKEIVVARSARLLTENLDQLHQKTGITPLCVQTDHVKQEISLDELKAVDAIVCIGLSQDAKGFLGWYKEHNSRGKIIAIDLKQPSYLSDGDVWLEGDIQKIIPMLKGQ